MRLTAILICGLTTIWCLSPAQTLTPEQVQAFERLAREAEARDPECLRALADLEAARAGLGLGGALTAEAGITLSGSYDQVSPGYRLALSLNLAELLRDKSPSLRALEAAYEARRRALRLRVLEALTGYLYALEAARTASDALEARQAEARAVQARARVGSATPAEALAAAEQVSQARLQLYRANLDLAVALEKLSATVGIPIETLRTLLRPGEGKGGTPGPAPAPKAP